MKKVFLIIVVVAIGITATWLYITAQNQAGYYGLPVVACVDSTLPVTQNYSFTLRLTADSKNIPLDANIGHDPGNCLRVIHTNDASGTVHVTSNDRQTYTIEDFFQVWHKQFSDHEFMGYVVNDGHHLSITVNGRAVSTLETTPLHSGDVVSIVYR